MLQCFRHEDAAQVALVGELAEHGRRRTPHGIAEIDGITQIDGQCSPIDNKVHAPAYLLPHPCLFLVQRQQHHDDVERVAHHDGAGVKHQAAAQHL